MDTNTTTAETFDVPAYIKETFAERDRLNPVRETITITLSTFLNFKHPDGTLCQFVRLASIPEKYHEFFLKHMRGSTMPAPDEKWDCFYQTDGNPPFINDTSK
jgi:hypothetical protein